MGRKKKEEVLLPGMRRKSTGSVEYRFKVGEQRFSVSGKDATECMEKAERKRREIESGTYKRGSSLTVSGYFERWLENKRGTVKETTLRTDEILLNRMSATQIDAAGRTFGRLKLTAVETQNVRDLQRNLQKELTVKRDDKEKTLPGMKTRSVNDSIHLLKAVFKAAQIERILQWNPAEGVKPLKRTEAPARDTIHRALTKKETAAFLEAAEAEHSAYIHLYRFLLNTGCRIGEAGALLPGDITKKGARICKTITRTEVGGYVIGDETKTAAGKRTVPLNAAARQAVDGQKEQNAALFGGKVLDIKQPVFCSPSGSLLKASSVNYDINKICKKAGIRRFSVHAFRDTFATRCVESGMDVKPLQEIMGHSDVTMTMGLYTHAMEETKEEQLKAVNFT